MMVPFCALEKAGLVGRAAMYHGTRRGAISMHADLGLDEQLSMSITGHRDACIAAIGNSANSRY
jgi:hypothetical protein